jgi:hypothetical protein
VKSFFNVVVSILAASICAYNLRTAVVHGYVRGKTRYIHRAKEPRQFWLHISTDIFCIACGIVVAVWNLISPKPFP